MPADELTLEMDKSRVTANRLAQNKKATNYLIDYLSPSVELGGAQ